jgi:serine/threonine protein phosphatase PrpC
MAVLRAAVLSHTGYVRSVNQDMAVVTSDLVAVADGMGGHLGGEVAARTAIEELLDEYRQDRSSDGLLNAARRANRAIWRKSRVDRKLHGMGTTLTAAALVTGPGEAGDSSDQGLPEHLVLVNIGDSRAYVLDRAEGRLRQLTEDHSVVEEMVRHGELTSEEAAVHPHRHVLTRVLGVAPEVALDVWDLDPVLGTRYLLCSDGLTNEVGDDEMAGVLLAAKEPADAARELVGRALGHGGADNVTVIVLDIVGGDLDPTDRQAELVPPRPPRPENPQLDEGEDITEAVPITAGGGQDVDDPERPAEVERGGWRRRRRRSTGAGLAAAAAGAALVGEPGAPSLPEDPSQPEDPSAPEDISSPSGDEATTHMTSLARGDVPVESAQTYESGAYEVARTGERRIGRSMTIRQGGVVVPSSQPTATTGSTPTPNDGFANDFGTSGQAAVVGSATNDFEQGRSASYSGRPLVLVPHKRTREPRDRLVTFRVVIFVVFLAGLLAGTASLLLWFNQSSYYVSIKGDNVVIYQGRPGGLLWLKPVVVETSSVHRSDLLPSTIAVLKGGILESSLDSANHVVVSLKNEALNAYNATTTTTSPPTTTTTSTTTTTLPFTTTGTGTVTQTTPPPATTTTTTTVPQTTTTTTSPTTTTTTATTPPST